MLKNGDNHPKLVFENIAFLCHIPGVMSSKFATLLKRKLGWKEEAFSPSYITGIIDIYSYNNFGMHMASVLYVLGF